MVDREQSLYRQSPEAVAPEANQSFISSHAAVTLISIQTGPNSSHSIHTDDHIHHHLTLPEISGTSPRTLIAR